ncbi:SapC family protein [Methylobacterium sp. WL69]|uniref:SapC family protein n=1 Tax=Methylobacterium sp. WL69 TaxID=2603893 RepID=UPI00164EE01A|nr:SapC family protein [Methylobacterium sp. WL69]
MTTDIRPVSRSRHANFRWQPYSDYRFTADTVVAPLAAAEISQAALIFPLAFIEQEGRWALVAVLGLQVNQNLFVDESGAWLGRYVPAKFRAHPFSIDSQVAGEPTFCVDEASRLVTEGGDGQAFFDETGKMSPNLEQVWSFLSEIARGEGVLAEACMVLANAGVIEPWPITLQSEQGLQQVVGLHRINELALNGLDDSAYNTLRRRSVLGVAYAQLLSIANFTNLGGLAQARAQAEAAARARAEVKPMIALPEDNTIDWDWSKIGR